MYGMTEGDGQRGVGARGGGVNFDMTAVKVIAELYL